jgi:hypothetical protein
MAQQTALEWFVNEVFGKNGLIIYADKIEQAKEMEKEQIIDAWLSGEKGISIGEKKFVGLAEQYYNETYNK